MNWLAVLCPRPRVLSGESEVVSIGVLNPDVLNLSVVRWARCADCTMTAHFAVTAVEVSMVIFCACCGAMLPRTTTADVICRFARSSDMGCIEFLAFHTTLRTLRWSFDYEHLVAYTNPPFVQESVGRGSAYESEQ